MHAAETARLRERVDQAPDRQSLETLSRQFTGQLVVLADQDLPPGEIGAAFSALGEATTRRLLGLAEAELGPPPVSYAFVVAGSLGRHEQIAASDQDNVLLLSDAYRPPRHDHYFARLARLVCDGLAQCGYAYCPGNIMASNPAWRRSRSDWQQLFARWIRTPDPVALLNASIHFDQRAQFGDVELMNGLRADILRKTRGNRIFLAHLAASAEQFRPALAWHGGLRFQRNAQGKRCVDLKKYGVTPVVDLARVHALASGHTATATRGRLQAMRAERVLTATESDDLAEAFDLVSAIRIRHQARQIRTGRKPDHLVLRREMSRPRQRELRQAFRVIRSAQRSMARRFGSTAFH